MNFSACLIPGPRPILPIPSAIQPPLAVPHLCACPTAESHAGLLRSEPPWVQWDLLPASVYRTTALVLLTGHLKLLYTEVLHFLGECLHFPLLLCWECSWGQCFIFLWFWCNWAQNENIIFRGRLILEALHHFFWNVAEILARGIATFPASDALPTLSPNSDTTSTNGLKLLMFKCP